MRTCVVIGIACWIGTCPVAAQPPVLNSLVFALGMVVAVFQDVLELTRRPR